MKSKFRDENYKVETAHFQILYNEQEKDCIDKVRNILESNYERITKNLCMNLHRKTKIKICSDMKELHLILGIENGQDWIRGGIGTEGNVVIASPLDPPRGADFDIVVKTAVHEFVHIVLNEINSDIPKWLDEGIASFEGGDNSEKWIKNTIRTAIEKDGIPSIQELDTGADFALFFQRNGYQFSYTIVEFIVEVFGYEKLNSLVRRNGDFEDVLKKSQDEFQNDWQQFLINNY